MIEFLNSLKKSKGNINYKFSNHLNSLIRLHLFDTSNFSRTNGVTSDN